MGWVVNSTPRPLYPREKSGTRCIGGWMGPRARLDRCRKTRPTGIRSPDRPARSESLYRLRYRGSYQFHIRVSKYGLNSPSAFYRFLTIMFHFLSNCNIKTCITKCLVTLYLILNSLTPFSKQNISKCHSSIFRPLCLSFLLFQSLVSYEDISLTRCYRSNRLTDRYREANISVSFYLLLLAYWFKY
jgi:hypothetical protein